MQTKRARFGIHACVAAVLATVVAGAPPGHAEKTYFIDEGTDFTGNGCEGGDLNTVTSSLQIALNSNGWAGTRYVNQWAYPQDFVEACSSSYGTGGLDSTYADFSVLSVYAGHGNVGALYFGYIRDGRCWVNLDSNMRLGSMAGSFSGYGMYVTSCTLKVESLSSYANWQWERQQFGFDNSPSVGGDDPKNFFNCTKAVFGSRINKSCWLQQLEDKPGWFTGDNSPIAVSYGTNQSDCLNTANTASLGRDILNSPRGSGPSCNQGQPYFYYCYSMIDHGGC